MDTTMDSDAGVQQYFKGIGKFLLEEGHDVRFLVPHSPRSKKSGEFKDKIISFGKSITPPFSTTSVPLALNLGSRQITKVLEREKFDVIHVGAPFSPMLGGKIIKHAKCPVVATYLIYTQDKLHEIGVRLLSLIQKSAHRKIRTMIVPSDAAEREARKVTKGLVDEKKFTTIPIGVDTSKFSPEVPPLDRFRGGRNILFLGRLEKRKGVEYLLRAFELIKREISDSKLIIAGDGPERGTLEALAEDLKLRDVLFEGYIDEKEKPRYYASADVCVFPALYGESFGVVLVEALASGKPVIAFANEGYSFVLKNMPESLVEVGDVKGLAEGVVRVLGGEEEKGIVSKSKSFSEDSSLLHTRKIYELTQ